MFLEHDVHLGQNPEVPAGLVAIVRVVGPVDRERDRIADL